MSTDYRKNMKTDIECLYSKSAHIKTSRREKEGEYNENNEKKKRKSNKELDPLPKVQKRRIP